MLISKITTETEHHIENYLCKRVRDIKGVCRKWVSPGHKGVPDRICIFENNTIVFVECKTATGRLSKLQQIEIATLKSYDCKVFVVSSKRDVDLFISVVKEMLIPKTT